MVRTEAQKKADATLAKKLWRKELRLHPEKYADVIVHLEQQENVTRYLVDLIRADLLGGDSTTGSKSC